MSTVFIRLQMHASLHVTPPQQQQQQPAQTLTRKKDIRHLIFGFRLYDTPHTGDIGEKPQGWGFPAARARLFAFRSTCRLCLPKPATFLEGEVSKKVSRVAHLIRLVPHKHRISGYVLGLAPPTRTRCVYIAHGLCDLGALGDECEEHALVAAYVGRFFVSSHSS